MKTKTPHSSAADQKIQGNNRFRIPPGGNTESSISLSGRFYPGKATFLLLYYIFIRTRVLHGFPRSQQVPRLGTGLAPRRSTDLVAQESEIAVRSILQGGLRFRKNPRRDIVQHSCPLLICVESISSDLQRIAAGTRFRYHICNVRSSAQSPPTGGLRHQTCTAESSGTKKQDRAKSPGPFLLLERSLYSVIRNYCSILGAFSSYFSANLL